MIYTVKKSSSGLYKEKGSKFIAYLYPISKEEEIKGHLDLLKEEHSKARHFCYAFRLGEKGDFERANDDGEPGGSAGLPILNQLHSAELTNVLLVVVRYFGGTKLGISGLIHAYKEASKSCIINGALVKYVAISSCTISFEIQDIGLVERMIRMDNLNLVTKNYSETCHFHISYPKALELTLFEKIESLKEISSLRIKKEPTKR